MANGEDETTLTALHDLREPLRTGIGLVQAAAAAVSTPEAAIPAIDRVLGYLEREAIASMRAEEFTMYIAVDGAIGLPGATEVMAAQHDAIEAMVDDLRKVRDRLATADDVQHYAVPLHALLYGLYAAIRLHIESEDAAYLPLLASRLSPSQMETVVTNLRRVKESFAEGAAPANARGT